MVGKIKSQVAFTWDTTGSMFPCFSLLQRKFEETFKTLFAEIPGLEIAIGAHGDYCDAGTSYVTRWHDFSSDLHSLTKFVRETGRTGGGDADECYELVLHEARRLSWSVNANKLFVPCSDAGPHAVDYPQNTKRLDWYKEAFALNRDVGAKICPVQCLSRGGRVDSYYRTLASLGGVHFRLDQFNDMLDLIMAICYKQAGDEQLAHFEETVVRAGRMNRTQETNFNTLSGRKTASRFKSVKAGLHPVPPGRFQVLDIEESDVDRKTGKVPIRVFVENRDIEFKTGRGFYEFTKPETIQEKKEVVLRDKVTGDMFTGDEARHMIGIPPGTRGRVKPAELDRFDVFVQSTSYNRALFPNTRFLYEVDLSR